MTNSDKLINWVMSIPKDNFELSNSDDDHIICRHFGNIPPEFLPIEIIQRPQYPVFIYIHNTSLDYDRDARGAELGRYYADLCDYVRNKRRQKEESERLNAIDVLYNKLQTALSFSPINHLL